MSLRSTSPVSESLLWKARLQQQNAQLLREKDVLKTKVMDLSQRVAGAEAGIKAIISLGNRVSSLEKEGHNQEHALAKLSADQDNSHRLLSEKYEATWGMLQEVQGKLNEEIEDPAWGRHHQETYALVEERLNEMNRKYSSLFDSFASFTANITSTNGMLIESNKSNGSLLASATGQVRQFPVESVDAIRIQTQEAHPEGQKQENVIPSTSIEPQQTVLMNVPSGPTISKIRMTKKPAAKSKAKKETANGARPKKSKELALQERASKLATGQISKSQYRLEAERTEAKQQEGRTFHTWRARTTRAGPSGWSKFHHQDEKATETDVNHTPLTFKCTETSGAAVQSCHKITSSRKRRRSDAGEYGSGNSRETDSMSPTERAKRAKLTKRPHDSKFRLPVSEAGRAITAISNMYSPAAARGLRTANQGQMPLVESRPSPDNKSFAQLDTLSNSNARVVIKPHTFATISCWQQKMAAKSMTSKEMSNRRRVRMPHLPPTPPPPSP